MGATLDSLNADAGVRIAHVVMVEGYQYALTDASDVAAIAAALAASSIAAHNAYAEVIGNAQIEFEERQRAHPWDGLDGESAALTFRVANGPHSAGSAGVLVNYFQRDVFKRSGGDETRLRNSLTPVSTSIVSRSTVDFDSGGTVYIGPEAIGYDTNDGATTLSDLTRAQWTPCYTADDVSFARAHEAVSISTITGDPTGVRSLPLVASEPRAWVGRYVEVWIVCERGAGTFDALDDGHRLFCGTIASVGRDSRGLTVVECEHVKRRIFQTVILREQWRAKLADGISLGVTTASLASAKFSLRTARQVSGGGLTVADANDLTIVSGTPASVNEIQVGTYTVAELGEAISAWIASEKAAGRILFHTRYDGAFNAGAGDGFRGRLSFDDPTSTSGLLRWVRLTLPSGVAAVHRFLGWNGPEIEVTSSTRTGAVTSPRTPLRLVLPVGFLGAFGTQNQRTVEDPSGTWVDQSALLPAELRDTAGLAEGVVKIGELGYAVVYPVSSTVYAFLPVGVGAYFGTADTSPEAIEVALDDDREFTVSQVLVAQGSFSSLLQQMLLSTGESGYNAGNDVLAATIACGIPYSVFGSGLATDLANLAGSGRAVCMVVDKPTKFIDLWQADFQLHWAHILWREGRLSIRSWSTPTTGALGAVTVLDTDRAQSAQDASPHASEVVEDESAVYNLVRIDYQRSTSGDLVSDIAIEDADSIGAHGVRPFKIEARNTASSAAVSDLRGLIPRWGAMLSSFSRPWQIITRTVTRQLYGQLPPLTPVILTDRSVPSPDTGLVYDATTGTGGLSGWPAVVLGQRCDYGAPVLGIDGPPTYRSAKCEFEFVIFGRADVAPYSPCAEVDSTATNAGYDAGTFTLTCLAHRHSGASEAVDASHFATGDKVRIRQIDPSVAASALSWDREVASVSGSAITLTAALSAPAWDNTLLYEIVSDDYADAVTTQRTDAYQADDDDYLVASLRQPYALAHTGSSQAATFTLAAATATPSRHSTLEYGDGVALDTGSELRIATLANSLVEYKTHPQTAATTSEEWVYGGTGTYELVAVVPVFLGSGMLGPGYTILVSVAPMFKSTDGNTATVRYTLSRLNHQGGTRDDVSFQDPYVQTSFSRTATTYAVPTVATLDTRHVIRGPGALGGLAWLHVEINAKVSIRGAFAHLRVGARSAV